MMWRGEGILAQKTSYECDFEKGVWTVVTNQLNMSSQDQAKTNDLQIYMIYSEEMDEKLDQVHSEV